MTATFLAGETVKADEVNDEINEGPRGVIARARRITSSSTTTTEIGVLRIDDIPLTSGRAYRIHTATLAITSSNGADIVRCYMKYTADGSTPTTGSAQIPGGLAGGDLNGGGSDAPTIPMNIYYAPSGGDELLSLLLTVSRVSGAGNASLFGSSTQVIDIWVEDIGVAVSDTGTSI